MKQNHRYSRLTYAEGALMTFEDKTLPAFLLYCLGLAFGLALLPLMYLAI
jgi:hypothetical protein